MTFKGGDGENGFTLDALAGTTRLTNLSVTDGDGFDTTTTGMVKISNGNGDSGTTIAAATTAAIAGTLSITNGDGEDNTVIGNGAGGNFSGLHSVTISNGAGNSSIAFNPPQMTSPGRSP